MLLKSERINQYGSGDAFLRCNNCGSGCNYWSQDLYDSLKDTNSLLDLYDKFSNRNPNIEYFVDASKRYHFFNDTNPFARIVCAKDPIRLFASYLYNKKNNFSLISDNYDDFRNEVYAEQSYIIKLSKDYFYGLYKLYERIFKNEGEFFYFQTDKAHKNDFLVFDDLKKYLKVQGRELDIMNFSQYECHSIGGNQAPLNLVKRKKNASVKSNPRFDYYQNLNEFGDWKVDDKYLRILPEEIIEKISSLSEFKILRDLLGYSE